MERFLIPAVIFFGVYHIFKNFTDFLLKRKIIKSGHFDKAGILDQQVGTESIPNQESNKYPSLKWGLVFFFAGIGLLVIDMLAPGVPNSIGYENFIQNSIFPFGIEFVCISLGFIVYFLIVNFSKKK